MVAGGMITSPFEFKTRLNPPRASRKEAFKDLSAAQVSVSLYTE
jgi:hypothetical protein